MQGTQPHEIRLSAGAMSPPVVPLQVLFDETDIIDAAYIGMGDLACNANLVAESY
jgi:hypothetical protein